MGYPSFLCIGAQRAGTTWLHSVLAQRPDVYMGPFKELQFFNNKFIPAHQKWTKWHVRQAVKKEIKEHLKPKNTLKYEYLKFLTELINPSTILSDQWYQDIYSSTYAKNKLLGDITPEYSTLPLKGIRFAKELCRTPKIIYIIRDPYRRAESQVRMAIERSNKKIWRNADWDTLIQKVPFKGRGDYATYVERWETEFSLDDILYIPFQDLTQNPATTMQRIESHIGLEPFPYVNLSTGVHSAKRRRIPRRIKHKIKTEVENQYDYLNKRFGKNFVDRI